MTLLRKMLKNIAYGMSTLEVIPSRKYPKIMSAMEISRKATEMTERSLKETIDKINK